MLLIFPKVGWMIPRWETETDGHFLARYLGIREVTPPRISAYRVRLENERVRWRVRLKVSVAV